MRLNIKLKAAAVAAVGLAAVGLTTHAADPLYWSWAQRRRWDGTRGIATARAYGNQTCIANADYMATNLKPHGWDIITIDIQWYEPLAHTTAYRRGALLEMDANGRLLPATNRFPMTAATRSFKPIADYLHSKGLKFGLHLLRGIPRQAVDRQIARSGNS